MNKDTVEKLQQVKKLVENGMHIYQACNHVGIGLHVYYKYKDDDCNLIRSRKKVLALRRKKEILLDKLLKIEKELTLYG